MRKLAQSLASQTWEGDLQPALAICELFDFLEEIQFWIKDRAGRYRWMNVACLLNLAFNQREEVLGKTDFDLLPARIATQFRADDELVLAGRRVVNRVELIGRFDHSARWFVTFKLPLHNRRGKVIGTAGIARPLKPGGEDWEGVPLGKVVGYISEHYGEPLDNAKLAAVADLSARTLERQFHRHYGISPRQYLKRLRVRLACHGLAQTNRPIALIAAEHGFADQSHFTREFRELLGETPREYRQNFRARGD